MVITPSGKLAVPILSEFRDRHSQIILLDDLRIPGERSSVILKQIDKSDHEQTQNTSDNDSCLKWEPFDFCG